MANLQTGPDGGGWTSYSLTVTSITGTITTVTATGRYKLTGKTVIFVAQIALTTNGTGATGFSVPLPLSPSQNFPGYGTDTAAGKSLACWRVVDAVYVLAADGSYPGVDGHNYWVGGSYEVA